MIEFDSKNNTVAGMKELRKMMTGTLFHGDDLCLVIEARIPRDFDFGLVKLERHGTNLHVICPVCGSTLAPNKDQWNNSDSWFVCIEDGTLVYAVLFDKRRR